MAINKNYTAGSWLVYAGQEDEFVRRWEDFARQSAKTSPGSGDFYLIQETTNPRHFLSFGSWESKEAVENWRQTAEFKEFINWCKQLLDDFQPGDYVLKVSSQDQ